MSEELLEAEDEFGEAYQDAEEDGLIRANHPKFESLFKAKIELAETFSNTLAGPSLADRLARLPKIAREAVIAELSPFDRVRLAYDFQFWARPKQMISRIARAAGEPRFILLMPGRGFGKGFSAAGWVRDRVLAGAQTLAIIGPTLTDIGKYQIHGPSGILAAFPPHQRPKYREDKHILVFHTGAIAHVITAEKPEWRGGNVDTVWWDELAKSKYRLVLWDNLELSLRSADSGLSNQALITTTPLPLSQLKELVLDEDCLTICGHSGENKGNLEEKTFKRWVRRFGGTRRGDQELAGKILTDNPNAKFKIQWLEDNRVRPEEVPDLEDVAISIDPAIETNENNDPTGIAGGGRAKGHLYIQLTDAHRWTSEGWALRGRKMRRALRASHYVAERNRGGNMVAGTIRLVESAEDAKEIEEEVAAGKKRRPPRPPPKINAVLATRGKQIRSEPVETLAEQGRLHFVGRHPKAEAELTEWDGTGASPNLLDAIVWLAYDLLGLSEEPEEDYSAGFVGMAAGNARLRRPKASPEVPPIAEPPDEAAPARRPRRERRQGQGARTL